MDDWQIAGRVMIGALHARYVATIDHHAAEDLPKLFTKDGVLASKITGQENVGEDIGRYLRAVVDSRVQPSWVNIRHFITPPNIDFQNPCQATAECYFAAFNADSIDHWGIYSDELEYTGTTWLFAKRSVDILGATPGGWVASGSARLPD
jgi:hypothetical protein